MTRSTTGTATDELRDVARDALKLGGRCVGVARDWLGEKREEFNMGRAAGQSGTTAGGTRYGSGAPAGRSRWARSGAPEDATSGASSGAGAGVTAHGYRGIGPRGYRRDDNRVREDVCDMLTDSDALDASNITVTVQDGVVKLAGSVPHRLMKRLAEDLAEGCSGVRDVENALRVGPPPHVGTPPMGGAAAGSSPGMGSSGGMGSPGSGPSSTGSSGVGSSGHGSSHGTSHGMSGMPGAAGDVSSGSGTADSSGSGGSSSGPTANV